VGGAEREREREGGGREGERKGSMESKREKERKREECSTNEQEAHPLPFESFDSFLTPEGRKASA
jgi:hypothetical protein